MASSVNKVILVGNLGKDPEMRATQDGGRIANLTLATSETWNDKSSGERKEKTEWHRVVCFNDNINKIIEQYLKKGAKIYLEGALQTRKWTDQQGQERYTTEVVIGRFNGQLTMLDTKNSNGDAGGYQQQPQAQPRAAAPQVPQQPRQPAMAGGGASWNTPVPSNVDADEIPF